MQNIQNHKWILYNSAAIAKKLLGVVVDKLRPIHISLAYHEYIEAIKAYTERLPVLCTGDLIKENNTFILKNPRQFRLDKVYH